MVDISSRWWCLCHTRISEFQCKKKFSTFCSMARFFKKNWKQNFWLLMDLAVLINNYFSIYFAFWHHLGHLTYWLMLQLVFTWEFSRFYILDCRELQNNYFQVCTANLLLKFITRKRNSTVFLKNLAIPQNQLYVYLNNYLSKLF